MKRTILFISKITLAFFYLFSIMSCEKDEVIKNNDASLEGIYIDAELIENFDSRTLNYELTLEYGITSIPQLTIEATDANSFINITQALEIPGTALITVIAEDGLTSLIYTVNFKEALPNTDATLNSIQIHGVELEGFNADQAEYQVELSEGTTDIPVVNAIANNESATVTITQATELPGTTTILVTAQDTEFTKEYTIDFTVPVSGFENITEILTSCDTWICTAYDEIISGNSDAAGEGSYYFAIAYDAFGSCYFYYSEENQFESTWEINEDNTKITYDKGTEWEYTTTLLELTQQLFKYNDSWITQEGEEVNYIFTFEPYNTKSFNKIVPNNSFNKRK